MADGITPRQAVELVSRQVGEKVSLAKLNRVVGNLAADGRMSASWSDSGLLGPSDVDVVAGEIWRMRTGWYRRRDVKGDYDAQVKMSDGTWRVLHLPWRREWDRATHGETGYVQDEIQMHAWPTGEEAGRLVRVADREGLPAYAIEGVNLVGERPYISAQESEGEEQTGKPRAKGKP